MSGYQVKLVGVSFGNTHDADVMLLESYLNEGYQIKSCSKHPEFLAFVYTLVKPPPKTETQEEKDARIKRASEVYHGKGSRR